MIHNALRKELAALLKAAAGTRKLSVRRSTDPEWIYSTDLPAVCSGAVPDPVKEALISAGWEYRQDGEWLLLRRPEPEPPEDWYAGPFGKEAGCCLSLLDRHPGSGSEPADAAQRMLIKAGEEGGKAYEEACGTLHREWAERLRQRRPLPAISRKYFGG